MRGSPEPGSAPPRSSKGSVPLVVGDPAGHGLDAGGAGRGDGRDRGADAVRRAGGCSRCTTSPGSRSAACWCGSCGACGGGRSRTGSGRSRRCSCSGRSLTGVMWSSAVHPRAFGYNPLNLHSVLGARCSSRSLAHALARAKRPRRARPRRGGRSWSPPASAPPRCSRWQAQRTPGLASAKRRFTGSYEVARSRATRSRRRRGSRTTRARSTRLPAARRATGTFTAAELDAGDELTATLDCTGGFYSTQRWRGIRLDRLLGDAPGSHVRVISHTGYRWSFDRDERASSCSPPTSAASRSATATARPSGSSRPGTAASSGSSG